MIELENFNLDFGNGGTSTLSNPYNIYTTSGVF